MERFDLLGAIDYVKQQGMSRIGVIGFSLGAATSLMALSETKEIDAVVSDSGYADLTDIIESEFGKRDDLADPAQFAEWQAVGALEKCTVVVTKAVNIAA